MTNPRSKPGPRPKVSNDAVRAVWADDSLVGAAAKANALGIARALFYRRIAALELPIPPAAPALAPQDRVPLTDDQIRAVWADASLPTVPDKARALGVSDCCLYDRSRRLGLSLPGRDLPVEPPPMDYSPEVTVEAGRRLFQAVILERWRCALDLRCKHVDQYDVAQARRWFGSPEFHLFCMCAGFDSDVVMQRYRAARGRVISTARAPVDRSADRLAHLQRSAA